MEFEKVVSILENLSNGELSEGFFWSVFSDMLFNSLDQKSARVICAINNKTPMWLHAFANASNAQTGKHEAIIAFFAEKGATNGSNT